MIFFEQDVIDGLVAGEKKFLDCVNERAKGVKRRCLLSRFCH